MTPDATPLYCAMCGAGAAPDASYCVACGQPLQTRLGRRNLTSVRIVEAEAQTEAESPQSETQAETALTTQDGERMSALAARLATLAWRQPVVRAAVQTGASALALSVVWRVAGAALAGGKARRALLPAANSLAPMVGDLLREAAPSKRLRRRGRNGEIVEEVIYIRRIMRR